MLWCYDYQNSCSPLLCPWLGSCRNQIAFVDRKDKQEMTVVPRSFEPGAPHQPATSLEIGLQNNRWTVLKCLEAPEWFLNPNYGR